MVSANSPEEFLCPGLRELTWVARSCPLDRFFLSPRVTEFSFLCNFLGQTSDEVLSNLTSLITELQTSSLLSLRIGVRIPTGRTPMGLKSAISSTVLRCGPSLTNLSVPTSLSDAAIPHIIQLLKLTTWRARHRPPRVPDLTLSDAFPQLEILELHVEEPLEWLPLFDARTPSNRR